MKKLKEKRREEAGGGLFKKPQQRLSLPVDESGVKSPLEQARRGSVTMEGHFLCYTGMWAVTSP